MLFDGKRNTLCSITFVRMSEYDRATDRQGLLLEVRSRKRSPIKLKKTAGRLIGVGCLDA